MKLHVTGATALAVAVAALAPAGARAQQQQTQREREAARQQAPTGPGAIPMRGVGVLNTGAGAIPIRQGVSAINTGAGAIPMRGVGSTTPSWEQRRLANQQYLPHQPVPGWKFTPYPNNPNNPNCPPGGYPYPYPYPYGNTTVIINPGTYVVGAPAVPGSVTVQSSVTPGYTEVETGQNAYGGYVRSRTTSTTYSTSVTLFTGYSTAFVAGQTVTAPYGSLYGCQPYVQARYVVQDPYPYLSGREQGTVRPWSDGDGYVNQDPARAQALRAALNDLTRYWEDEDVRGLRRRLSPDLSVAVFQGEQFAYSLKQRDFLDISSDALDRVRTMGFRFTEVRERNDGLVNAYATHRYRVRGETETRVATVRCTLVYTDGDWFLNAVSLSPGSLAR